MSSLTIGPAIGSNILANAGKCHGHMCKQQKGNKKLLSKKKKDFLAQGNATKGRTFPNASPYSSSAEDRNRSEDMRGRELNKDEDKKIN